MKIIGIDPGKKGAICFLNTETSTATYLEIPYRPDGLIDFKIINEAFLFAHQDHIYIEKVSGRDGWGAVQCFSFGANCGMIRQWCWDKPHTLIVPKTWQKIAHIGTSAETAKLRSSQSFFRLNPNTNIKKSQDGIIDAFHIARYGLFQYRAQFSDNWEFIKHE